jgi:two-component system, OmpR family, response regulator
LSPFDRAIDVHISRLRKRIEADPKEPEMIRTVRSEGDYFAAPVSVAGAVP